LKKVYTTREFAAFLVLDVVQTEDSMNKRFVVGTLVALALLGAAWGVVQGTKAAEPGKAFDARQWQAVDGRSSTERLAMIDDLVQSNLLIGKTAEEVRDLLGDPEPVSYFENAGFDMMYVVGEGRGLLPGPEYLAVDLSAEGTVQSVDVRQD
jgi:hypothetical protein